MDNFGEPIVRQVETFIFDKSNDQPAFLALSKIKLTFLR